MSVNDVNDDVTTVESNVNHDDEINQVNEEIPNGLHDSSEIALEISKASGVYNIRYDYEMIETWVLGSNVIIEGNGHTLYGHNNQAFYVKGKNATIKNLNFIECKNENSGAGAIEWSGNNGCLIGCTFRKCSAKDNGGAIYWSGSNGKVSSCRFTGCSVTGKDSKGSAIYIAKSSSLSITSSRVTNGDGDLKAPIYNDGTILSDLVIVTMDGKIKRANFGDKVKLIANVTTSGIPVAGGTIKFILDCKGLYRYAFDGTSDINDLYSKECSIEFDGLAYVNSNYSNGSVGDQSLIIGKILTRIINVNLKVDNVSGLVGNTASVNIRVYDEYGDLVDGGIVTVNFNGIDYTSNVTNGSATINLDLLKVGKYNLMTYYEGSATGIYNFNKSYFTVNINKIPVTVTPTAITTTYGSNKYFQVKVVNANGKAVSGLKLTLKVYTGSKVNKTVTVTTDANGIAKYSASKLSIGTHKVVVSLSNAKYVSPDKTSSITIFKAKKSSMSGYGFSNGKESVSYNNGVSNSVGNMENFGTPLVALLIALICLPILRRRK